MGRFLEDYGLWTLEDAFWMLGGNACYEQFMLIYK